MVMGEEKIDLHRGQAMNGNTCRVMGLLVGSVYGWKGTRFVSDSCAMNGRSEKWLEY